MDRLQKVISVLEIELHTSEEKMKEKSKKIEELQTELSNVQAQYVEYSLKFKQLNEENTSLKDIVDRYEKERKDILAKCSEYNE